jgi:hypothetical protein
MNGQVRSAFMDIVESRELGDDRYRVVIAANERIRQPPELDFAGLSTEGYDRNPVVMWAHDVVGRSPSGGLPIGRTVKLTKASDSRLIADFEFLSEDPFAQRVKNAWDRGFLQAASISWLPLEGAPTKDGRWRDSRSELLEWSIVAVPADPDALKESHRLLLAEALGGSAERDAGTRSRVAGGPGGSEAGVRDADLREIGALVRAVRAALDGALLQ